MVFSEATAEYHRRYNERLFGELDLRELAAIRDGAIDTMASTWAGCWIGATGDIDQAAGLVSWCRWVTYTGGGRE